MPAGRPSKDTTRAEALAPLAADPKLSAAGVARQLTAQGMPVDGSTVTLWAKAAGVSLPRRNANQAIEPQTEEILSCLLSGTTVRQVLDHGPWERLTRQRVHAMKKIVEDEEWPS